MQVLPLVLTLFLAWPSQALICELIDNPEASTMRVSYDDFQNPKSIELKSPDQDLYRLIPVVITPLTQENEVSAFETFVATPNITSDQIEWENETFCYKEVGTLWYFSFSQERQMFSVQFVPYLVKENPTCMVPRFQPQTHRLNCQEEI